MSTTQDKSLTLAAKIVNPSVTKLFQGLLVPWEITNYQEEYALAQTRGGLFDLTDHVLIEIKGQDAQDYLQRMTTVQFKTLDCDHAIHGAFLTGRGGVVALGVFLKIDSETFHFLVSVEKKERVLEHIEQFHFSEQFAVRDLSQEYAVLGCWSPNDGLSKSLGIAFGNAALNVQKIELHGVKFIAWKDIRRPSLFWIIIGRDQAVSLIEQCQKNGQCQLGRRLFEFFRLEAAIPWSGNELTEKDIILEGNFNEAVARNKGCYPGQEVVERIFTYGQVNRKLQRVTLLGDINLLSHGGLIFYEEGKEVGQLVSWIADPRNESTNVGLMFVKKEFWTSQHEWKTTLGVRAKLNDIS